MSQADATPGIICCEVDQHRWGGGCYDLDVRRQVDHGLLNAHYAAHSGVGIPSHLMTLVDSRRLRHSLSGSAWSPPLPPGERSFVSVPQEAFRLTRCLGDPD